jgi:dTMP kinase
MKSKGLFIVLEGIDGSGKTTLARGLKSQLESVKGWEVVLTAEPTTGPVGSLLREEKIDSPRAEAMLFIADRACHTDEIRKLTEEGKTVICDRYYASTLAYQSASGSGPVLDYDLLVRMNESVTVEPDITILLDIDPEVSGGRVDSRGEQKSKFERLEFQKRVRDNYLRIAKERGFSVLDASKSPEDLCSEAMKLINDTR